MATGVTEEELLRAVVGPDLDSITAQNVLYRLREQSLYLHFDGVHYVFKTTPNITQTLEDEFNHVKTEEADEAIETDLRSQLAGSTSAMIWPKQSQDIPDGEPRFSGRLPAARLCHPACDGTRTSKHGNTSPSMAMWTGATGMAWGWPCRTPHRSLRCVRQRDISRPLN